jgi:tetratricopeptide (TPR) repeat protein
LIVRKIIVHSTKKHVRRERLKYGMIVYLHSSMRVIGESVHSAVCHYQSILTYQARAHAAANGFATAVNMPICYVSGNRVWSIDVHSVESHFQINDPKAFCGMGQMCLYEGNDEGAFEYYTKAAELGDAAAHWNLSIYYNQGIVVEKNEKKAVYHWEKAAIGGHPFARYNLGNHEFRNRRIDRAVKHWIIAANQGFDDALDVVKQGFRKGYVSKEEYASTLRGHQAAVDATKSEQRDAAYVLSEQRKKVANRCQIAGGVTKKFTKKGSRKG